ncbi:Polyadenylate-binding protein RBP47B', partial [Mucuna pruriens]
MILTYLVARDHRWSAYYGYGQGYEAYAYGTAQDPSLYAYGAYAGYAQCPQHEYIGFLEGGQDPSNMSVPTMEQREELYDPLAMPDVDKALALAKNLFVILTAWMDNIVDSVNNASQV